MFPHSRVRGARSLSLSLSLEVGPLELRRTRPSFESREDEATLFEEIPKWLVYGSIRNSATVCGSSHPPSNRRILCRISTVESCPTTCAVALSLSLRSARASRRVCEKRHTGSCPSRLLSLSHALETFHKVSLPASRDKARVAKWKRALVLGSPVSNTRQTRLRTIGGLVCCCKNRHTHSESRTVLVRYSLFHSREKERERESVHTRHMWPGRIVY